MLSLLTSSVAVQAPVFFGGEEDIVDFCCVKVIAKFSGKERLCLS
jgi:hypothetical protein